jgi:hypothetical protein
MARVLTFAGVKLADELPDLMTHRSRQVSTLRIDRSLIESVRSFRKANLSRGEYPLRGPWGRAVRRWERYGLRCNNDETFLVCGD